MADIREGTTRSYMWRCPEDGELWHGAKCGFDAVHEPVTLVITTIIEPGHNDGDVR